MALDIRLSPAVALAHEAGKLANSADLCIFLGGRISFNDRTVAIVNEHNNMMSQKRMRC